MKTLFTLILLLFCFAVNAQNSLAVTTNLSGEIIPNKISGKQPMAIQPGDSVMLYIYFSKQKIWNAKYNDVTGMIADSLIKQSPDYIAFRNSFIDRDHKADMIKKYGKLQGTDIANKIVKIGMTKAMVEDAYGKPEAINRSGSSRGMREQWVYEHLPGGKTGYCYFENDKLISRKE